MNKMGTVVGFTFMNKVRTKSFLITTLVLALLVTIGMHVPYFIDKFTGGDDQPSKIGLVYEGQPELAKSLEAYTEKQQAAGYTLVPYEQADKAVLQAAIDAGDIDGYLQFAEADSGVFPTVTYTSKKDSLGMGLQTALQAALQNVKAEYLTKGMLTDEQIAALSAPVQIDAVKASVESSGSEAGNKTAETGAINYVIVYVLIILFFMTIMMTGNMIAAEVTAEKSSRIMEILITSVSPLAQMFGKILGMFLIGLLQIAIFAGVIAVNISLPYNQPVLADFNLQLSDIRVEVLVLGLVFYVLGYFLYATLFAAIGSLVSRTEELGQAIMPITMLSLAAFYIGIFSLSAPNSVLMKVSSYIPFVSPVSMIVRVGIGEPPVWEIAASLVVLTIAIFLFGWLSAKIYRTGVLLYGKRPSFKELRKAMKAYKI
ncbi:MAG: ABC transporter permease [Paenibacillaceae bacterium]|uniref:ABC transporter permease n=1 Tax=Paenibacillus mellifer TaxID=2937794 RepID=A0A9X2BS12_9BACL|nr:ABC transporter permease [Paenibacillus mellifer]MBW4840463.1 ABC transporter permease [Paenibacillaceae bacterium]MCK8490053.1 ABC transporter permease [Paenibacillus mellifer]